MKILVVEDEVKTGEYLRQGLREAGFNADLVHNGVDGLHLAQEGDYDLVILDVMLPGMDGWQVLTNLRRHGQEMPVLFLTAKDQVQDRIKGLELGADDYIAKPFSPRELMARIKALLRRAEFRQPEKEVVSGRKLKFAGWTLDSRTQLLTHEDGSSIDLTGSDFILLHLFLQHPGQILDRDAISDATRGRESLPMERGIDVQISRLRQKLGDNGKGPRIIKTIRGSGYMLIADVVHED